VINITAMRKIAVILCLFMLSGCGASGNSTPVSRFDIAIENLSRTSLQLENLQKEKDLFAKTLEDFEQQKAEYNDILGTGKANKITRAYAQWHRDITQREKDLAIEHAMNVSAAHREILKRKAEEQNQTAVSAISNRKF
jgi:hypothetical protein